MANTFTPISAVCGGKKDLKFIVRIAHIWCTHAKSNPNEITFMNMLLVDENVSLYALILFVICKFKVLITLYALEFNSCVLLCLKGGKIHASVRKSLVPHIKSMVEEGLTYRLEHVMVGFIEGPLKLTPHKYKLNMMRTTKFTKVNAQKVPKNVFDFMSFKDVLSTPEEDKIICISCTITVQINCIFINLIAFNVFSVFDLV